MSIGAINGAPLSSLLSLSGSESKSGGQWSDFSNVLSKQIKETDRLQKEAKEMTQKALLGNAGVSIHEAQIASSQAELHTRLLMEVRNKAVEVYKEVMSMPV
ncbi:MAG: flagellar hook-basal body complex protein FliE [Magnetococcales bacterium]|nr:flagellar hook-basal body complex protein FliE [Magnetococcales bacterium]